MALFLCAQLAFGQATDSLTQRYDSLAKIKLTQLDSSGNRFNKKVDSAQLRLNNILNPNFNKLTSKISRKKLLPSDTLRAKHELDSLKGNIAHHIDSLRSINLPTDRYTKKLDSLSQIGPQKYIQLVNNKSNKLENAMDQSVNKLEDRINKPISDVENKLGKSINSPELNISEKLETKDLSLNTKLPDVNVDLDKTLNNIDSPISGQTGQLNDLKGKGNGLKDVPQQQLQSVEQLQVAKEKVGDINQVTDKLQSYQGDVKNIANNNVGDVKEIPKTIESKVGNLDEIKDLQKQTGELDKAKGMIDKGKDAEALKKMAKEEMIKQSINHFKGQEQALQAAMDKMTKLKSKYPEVSSLKDISKRPPNPMKGKPLIERIVPGMTFEVQKMNSVNVDINPVVSYRFTHRINAGLGWNERLSFTKWNQLSKTDRIFGPRVFGSFNFKKGFSVKADIEKMNALVPASPFSSDGSRQWVWSAFVGLKKDYKFMGKVKGNIQVLYNLYDDHDNSPYADRFSIRTGFEFPMRKKEKPQPKTSKTP